MEELATCGPIYNRWMYPIERTMGTFTRYVQNWARPEASMAVGYMVNETLGFVTKYMQGFQHV
jgi:hypothetical protein